MRARSLTLLAILLLSVPSARAGNLLPLASLIDGNGAVDGLGGAYGVAMSPDGKHVYVTGITDGAVAVFARDRVAGTLSFVQAVVQGQGGITGLTGARGIVVSPDGKHVYAAGENDNAVVAFSRDATTGELTKIDEVQNGIGGVSGLTCAWALAISPDGGSVYAAGPCDNAVAVFTRNPVNGLLGFANTVPGPITLALAVSHDGSRLYAAGADDFAVFARAGNGALTPVETEHEGQNGVSGLATVESIAISPDGAHIYTGGLGNYARFTRNGSGGVDFVESVSTNNGSGRDYVAMSPDGGTVIVSRSDQNATIDAYARDPLTGALTYFAGVSAAFEPRFSVFSPDGAQLYTANNGTSEIAARALPVLGDDLEVQVNGFSGVQQLDAPLATAVSSDGKNLYAVAAASNAVVAFTRTAATGHLGFLEAKVGGAGGIDGLSNPTAVAISPDGKHVYATGLNGNAVIAFSRNASTGALTYVETEKQGVGGVDGMSGASGVALSPDGKSLYVAAQGDLLTSSGSIAVFARNATTGALAFVERKQDDAVTPISGLAGAISVAVSPDGKHVYVASAVEDSVAVFGRNATTGALSFVESDSRPGTNFAGLDGADSVALSPDGAHVYVASSQDGSLVAFERDAATGALSWLDVYQDGVAPVEGLGIATSVAVSHDGRFVYAVGLGDGDLVVFHRDVASGLLGIREVTNGPQGWTGVYAVTVEPEDRQLYLSGSDADAIVVRAPEPRGRLDGEAALAALVGVAALLRWRA